MTTPSTSTVVLIHGLWMTPLAWEHWVERYEARGFTVLTPGYPGIGQGEAGLQALRENPDAVAGVGVREIMDYMTDYISKLDTGPIIMGHSFGGTFAQLLVGNGLGAAGVSIDGAPVKGINTIPLSEVRSVLPALNNPANINRASVLTPKQFHYAFTNAQDEAPPSAPTTATPPHAGQGPVPGRFRRRHPARVDHVQLRRRRPGPAAVHLRRQRPHPAPGRAGPQLQEERQALHRDRRAQGVPRPGPLHLRGTRLGSRRRLRPRLGPHPGRRRTRLTRRRPPPQAPAGPRRS